MVMPQSWIAIGFGSVMDQTDMAFWNADGEESTMRDLVANKRVVTDDVQNNYNSHTTFLPNGAVAYTSTRPLAPSSPKSFVIPLDTPIQMICAWFTTSPDLQKHGPSNHLNWEMTLFSDGTVSSSGGIRPLAKEPLLQTPNGSILTAWYDKVNDWVEFDVWVKPSTWIAIGFGTSMTETDVAFFSSNGTMLDMYATGHAQPQTDIESAYTNKFSILADGTVNFRSYRKLDPGQAEDFVIQLDKPI